MQIVIDIPKKVYEAIKSGFYTSQDRYDALDAVQDGTPLPDNHGRLIDADALTLMDVHLIDGIFLCDAPTIIEAEERSEDEVSD